MGKSEIASRHFAPWVLGQHPEWEIIAASGAQSLATSFSRYIRDLVRSDSYKPLFPEMRLDEQGVQLRTAVGARQHSGEAGDDAVAFCDEDAARINLLDRQRDRVWILE
jgi:hypothetical protein